MRFKQGLEQFRDDLKFALRQARRAPGFTLIAVATLALGIGANSAIFAMVDATLLRPLPFPNPDRLVMVWDRTATVARGSLSSLNILDLSERTQSFEALGGFIPGVGSMVITGADGTAETVPRQWVTSGIFDALGVTPLAGRTFGPEDEKQLSVILSEGLWRTRFAADPGVIGQPIRLDGESFTIVGVVPESAELIGDSSIWAVRPVVRNPTRMFYVVGRLKPGVSVDAAVAELSAVSELLARDAPAAYKGRGLAAEPLRDAMIGSELRLTSVLFLGVVGFVLLICCANVANLLLARAMVRGRELAIRSALGAGRGRVIRQLLTESLVLALVGGAVGIAVGAAILNVAPTIIPAGLLPAAVELTFDGRVVAFCLAAAAAVGLLFGLAPAWQAREFSSARVMMSDSRSATGRGGVLRAILVSGEVAAATLLLCGAGLLLRTLLAVDSVDRGYRAEQVLTMMVDPLGSQYPTPESLQQFLDAVEQEVRALPGVADVAWAGTLPLGPSQVGRVAFDVPGSPPVDESRRPLAEYQVVSPTYFRTIDLPIVAGRGFSDRDIRGGLPVAIVDEALARRFFSGADPVGRQISVRSASPANAPATVRQIVGVARQVKGRLDESEEMLQIYVPSAQNLLGDIFLTVRAAGSAEALTPSVRAAIGRIDRAGLVSVRDVATLNERVWEATSRHRFRAVMVLTFAGLALLLSMIGVFGILTYTVQQRVREFGVRMALGASAADVVREVVGRAVRVIGAGAAIGLTLAALLGRSLSTVLFGVEPLDLITFAAAALIVAATAAVASAAPAWRAARTDPAVALRAD